MKITLSVHSGNKKSIWAGLTERLGREPTPREARDEVKRILREVTVDLADQGKLPHQRKRKGAG